MKKDQEKNGGPTYEAPDAGDINKPNIPIGAEQESLDVSEDATTAPKDELPFSKESPIVINRIAKNEKGGIDYVLSLSADQTYILLNFAVMFLMSQGLLMFAHIETPPEETEETITLGNQLH